MAKQKLTPEEKAQRKAERKEKFKAMNAKNGLQKAGIVFFEANRVFRFAQNKGRRVYEIIEK